MTTTPTTTPTRRRYDQPAGTFEAMRLAHYVNMARLAKEERRRKRRETSRGLLRIWALKAEVLALKERRAPAYTWRGWEYPAWAVDLLAGVVFGALFFALVLGLARPPFIGA